MEAYEYIAFISYKSSDRQWAKWLHATLEAYQMPIYLREMYPEVSPELHPIFMDVLDLRLGDLGENIKDALKNSKFLLVLCSTDTPQSVWVNNEIREFVRHHDIDYIIPFIVSGTPEDSYPDALKELMKVKEMLGANIAELDKEYAVSKVIARILNLEIRAVYDKHLSAAKEKEERERKERIRLQKLESRFLSEKAMDIAESGNVHLARKLALYSLPKNLTSVDERPLIVEAERTLRSLMMKKGTTYDGHDRYNLDHILNDISISPNGEFIATASRDRTAMVMEVNNGRVVHTFNLNAEVCCVAISPDSTLLATGTSGRDICLWNVKTGDLEARLKGHSDMVMSLTFSKDGRFLVSTSRDGSLKVWDYVTGKCVNSIDGFKSMVYCNDISCDSRYVVARSYQDDFRVYDLFENRLVLEVPSQSAEGSLFCNNGTSVMIPQRDCLQIWDVQSRNLIESIPLTGFLRDYSISEDGSSLIVLTTELLQVWNIADNKWAKVFEREHEGYRFCRLAPDGKRMLLASTSKIDMIPFSEDRYIYELAHDANASSIAINHDSSKMAVSLYKEIVVWDTVNAAILKTINHDGYIYDMKFLPDGETLVVASGEKPLQLIDSNTGASRNVCEDGPCNRILLMSNGERIIASGNGNSVNVWDVETGKCLKNIGAFKSDITSMSLSSDEKLLLIASGSDVFLYDFEAQSITCTIGSHGECVSSVAFSHDSRYAAIADWNRGIKVWDVTSNEMFGEFMLLDYPESCNNKVAFSLDDRSLIVATDEDAVVIFDVNTSKVLMTIKCHEGSSIECFAMMPDGKHFATAATDYKVRVWKYLPLQELIDQTAQLYSTNPLSSEEKKEYYIE